MTAETNSYPKAMQINKIYNESCLDTMARMPDGFIDLTVTSPPYDNLRTYNNDVDKTWNQDVWQKVISSLYRVTKEGGVCVWIVNDATINGSETGTSFRQALYAMECGWSLHDTMIYKKDGNSYPDFNRYYSSFEFMFVFSKGKPKTVNLIKDKINKQAFVKVTGTKRQQDGRLRKMHGDRAGKVKALYGCRQNVWEYGTGFNISSKDVLAFKHPATFPEKLAADHIVSWSNENDLVYDPFMGSGTTAKMSHIHKRRWIGSEISEEYIDIAEKRLHPYLTQMSLF